MKKISVVVPIFTSLLLMTGCSQSSTKSNVTMETAKQEEVAVTKATETQEKEAEETIYGKYLHKATGEFKDKPKWETEKGLSEDVRQKPVPERYPDELVLKEDGLVDFIYYQKDEEGEAEVASNVKLFTLSYEQTDKGIRIAFPKQADNSFNYMIKADRRNTNYSTFLKNNGKFLKKEGVYDVYDATAIVDDNDLKLGLSSTIGTVEDVIKKGRLVSIRKEGNHFIKDTYVKQLEAIETEYDKEEQEYDFGNDFSQNEIEEIISHYDASFNDYFEIGEMKQTKGKIEIPVSSPNDSFSGHYTVKPTASGDYQVNLIVEGQDIGRVTISSGTGEVVDGDLKSSIMKYVQDFTGEWSINKFETDKAGSVFELSEEGFKLQTLRDGHSDPLITDELILIPQEKEQALIVSGVRDRGIVSGGTDVEGGRARYSYRLTKKEDGITLYDLELNKKCKVDDKEVFHIEQEKEVADKVSSLEAAEAMAYRHWKDENHELMSEIVVRPSYMGTEVDDERGKGWTITARDMNNKAGSGHMFTLTVYRDGRLFDTNFKQVN